MADIEWCSRKRSFSNVESNDKDQEQTDDKKIKNNGPVIADKPDNLKVFTLDREVYFYTSFDNLSSIAFQKEVSKVYKSLVDAVNNAKNNGFNVKLPPIVIHINSPGGGIFSSFSMIDYLLQLKHSDKRVKIHTIVEGRAASAATLLSVTGDKRYITKYGYMLIHQLSSVCWGKYNELKDDMENCDILMERIKEIYKTHTKVPEDDMDKILSHDLYWNAEKCLEMGLVDEIIE